jgi:carboxymethylenebutenolidase
MQKTELATDDGTCPTYVFRPTTGAGPWPAVLFFMDGIGIRPALFDIAQRIADGGYVVVMPDVFYRAGAYTAPEPAKLFSDPEFRKTWASTYIASANRDNVMRDTRAVLGFIDRLSDVVQGKVGTTGYCMGGALSLAAAAYYPDRVAAAAAFHPANLATDQPTSPHLLAPKIKGRVLVAGATEDANFPDEQRKKLDDALSAAGVQHTVEKWPAKHGWVPSDTPVHDPEQAARHDRELLELYRATLAD